METQTTAYQPRPLKEGDWCYCDFELRQITKMENGRINELKNGIITFGGDLTDRCYPVDMDIKRISDDVAHYRKNIPSCNALNYSDIHNAFVDIWMDMCTIRNNEKQLKAMYKKLIEFSRQITKYVENLRQIEANGVKIFR